jgi:head-tail adaptor
MMDDGLQTLPMEYAPHGMPVWASKTPVSDGERFRADTVMRDMTDRFVVRWSEFTAGITGSDRLECEGVVYGIAGRKEIGRREGIEITASRVDI